MAPDQRYCLECGERRPPTSTFLMRGGPTPASEQRQPPVAPRAAGASSAGEGRQTSALTLIAAVGVLMLAMGVGVLIGRSGSSKPASGPAQVITVGGGAAGGTGSSAAAEAFASDWPSGTSGYTVQLQTLPVSGTGVSAVAAAKAAASAKGAKGVGALKSEEFSSLAAGNYVIYAGVEKTKAEAQKLLVTLTAKFPGASVIRVSSGGSASGSEASKSSGAPSSGAGSSPTHPAPPSVLENLNKAKGKTYEERSKNLPNSVET